MLERVAKSKIGSHRAVQRATVLLRAANGTSHARISREVGVNTNTVRDWRSRFLEDGLNGIETIRQGRGRKPVISDEKIQEIVELTEHSKPENATHWSVRSMAARVGVSPTQMQRIWAARGLKPHLVKTFKVSTDPKFEEKLIDVCGLYLSPPENAIVLCVDEKTSIQALDRPQPSLPLTKGRASTCTHDYKRNGTTTLFAALEVATGKVIGSCVPKHRHDEFLAFLNTIEKEVPAGLEVHLIVDNYATHKHANVQKWLEKHPRFLFHFTPMSSSWLNLIERWFRDLSERTLRRGVFRSAPDLVEKIEDYIRHNNEHPKPFVWTPTADSILAKVARGGVALNKQNKTETHY
ncbi:IS630 family transposase [Leucobacter insecticola]|uniref:IS630 family transposase n=1 Tax=Leucobacter insecticola TaxID=2714934 RepID=A0A6G8FLU2_9MICO|nr:IS630 family transposase [Leucobacter insecticola]QIM17357.1 IS630 family transposase [Leucobacter insecticola]